MKPILKWTGGKSSELAVIKTFLPKNYDRLVEPFLGGGAVFFDFENKKSLVNDFNKELISFYNMIKNNDLTVFEEIITRITREREAVMTLDIYGKTLEEIFELAADIGSMPTYAKYLNRELTSKTKTLARINRDNAVKELPELNAAEIQIQYQTALTSAVYYTYREAYNDKNKAKAYDNEHISYWFIMRELAYSGMFRFSSTGNFNVPYGGISYNKKSLLTKLKYVKEMQKKEFFTNCEFNNGDFEVFFKKYDYFTENDFIFLDPPYDSEFSQYNVEEDFTKDDQIRLRDALLKTKAKVMVVIKETPFIRSIYEKDFDLNDFDKNYSVNFKNRNDREVNHLVITRNYKIDPLP